MAFLVNAPEGFRGSSLVVSRFPQDILLEVSYGVIKFLENKVGDLDAHGLQHQLSLQGIDESIEAVQGAINCLVYVFRGALLNKLSPEELVAGIKTSTLLGTSVVPVIKHVWTEQSPSLISTQHNQLFSVGRLAKLDWKLSVATQSSSCKSLASPFVAAVFHLSQPDGTLASYPVELTLAEFHNVSKQVKAIAAALETA